jgi:hypothetical protein
VAFSIVPSAAANNLVSNGNFSGGTLGGCEAGNCTGDSIATDWLLDAADATNFHIVNISGTNYAQFESTATAQDLANGYQNGIGIPNGQPDQDCFYQPINVIAGQQYDVSFTVTVTGTVGGNTLLIPEWNWVPTVGSQVNMADSLYGAYNTADNEYSAATGDGSVTENFLETAPTGNGISAGQAETVNLMFHGSDVTGGSILLSNVSVTGAPEPSSLLLTISGILLVGLCFRTRTPLRPGRPLKS